MRPLIVPERVRTTGEVGLAVVTSRETRANADGLTAAPLWGTADGERILPIGSVPANLRLLVPGRKGSPLVTVVARDETAFGLVRDAHANRRTSHPIR